MISLVNRNEERKKRHLRIRAKLEGTKKVPRLSVFRSNKFIYCQIIDDIAGKTLVQANTKELKLTNNIKSAEALGQDIAKKALAKGIKAIVFDRSGYKYHGRIKALAENARTAGLKF